MYKDATDYDLSIAEFMTDFFFIFHTFCNINFKVRKCKKVKPKEN